jgi:pyruvate formate-lyase/glycerol dehydratase family glycyl radical enzyme
MNERVRRLREASVKTKPCIASERAVLVTEFYEGDVASRVSVPVARALAFKHLLENKHVYVGDEELIVGERGPGSKLVPTYPEICCHSLGDLEILGTRKKTPYEVDAKTRKVYSEKVIPFWKSRSIRDVIFGEMSDDWKSAYDAGVFTEFLEQRAPGHTALDDKIYRKGLVDFKEDIKRSMESLDFLVDPNAHQKMEELKAMEIAADALICYALRHVEKVKQLLRKEKSVKRKRELKKIIDVCSRVPKYAPRDFWEALQHYWFIHLGVIMEVNPWDAFNPGRLDQHLYPFFKRGLEDGSLTREKARELLELLWVKFNNQPAPPKVGVTAEESNTYNDFALVNLGGVKFDGSDAVNELSYLILDVVGEMRIPQPGSMVQISKKSPDSFLKCALEIIKTGFGQPSVFNTDAIVQELLRQGKTIEDARNGGASGCVETGAFGKESYILTGYFNLPKVLEVALNNGVDPRTGRKVGVETGNPCEFESFKELFGAFKKQLEYFVDVKIRGNNVIERLYAEVLPVPFLSVLISDCIRNGKDYNDGGARYNTNYIQGVGLGTVTDSLTALKYHVYDRKQILLSDFLMALSSDFRNCEVLRQRLLNKTPKYGNDDDYVDSVMREVFETYFGAIDGRPNTKGGKYRVNLLPTTVHIYFGKMVGASADGRRAGEPLSEGVSPVQGADRKGPTAVVKSVSKIDHVRTGGTLLNQKFAPELLESEEGLSKLANLVRGYFRLDGHHVQFNVVNAETLREAQRHPEKYGDLLVRVAGFSDYFVNLSRELQDEIIKRTEHRSF